MDSTRGTIKPAAALAAVLLVGCAAGLVGFLLGRDSARTAATPRLAAVSDHHGVTAARQDAYRQGVAAGRRAATPRRTYRDGLTRGRAQGREQGGLEALGGASFDFAPATFYIVQFATGAAGAQLRVSDAHEMAPGVGYQLCNTNDLCQRTR